MFKLRKNCNSYFDAKELVVQVDRTIEIFEGKVNGLAQGLFLFNNALSHQKQALNVISANNMAKSASNLFF